MANDKVSITDLRKALKSSWAYGGLDAIAAKLRREAYLATFDTLVRNAENWDLLLARLPNGIAIDYMNPNFTVHVREKELLEALDAVTEGTN